MSTTTSRLGLYKPADDGSEVVNITTDLNNNWGKIDAVIGAVPATSTTPPSTTFNGMLRQNTDTGTVEYYKTGTTWTQMWTKGVAFTGHALMTIGNRIGINTLSPGAVLDAIVASSTELFARYRVGSEVNPRLQIDSDGIRIGPGGATAPDVRMYRVAAGTLNVSSKVVLESDLLVSGVPSFVGGFTVTNASTFDGDVNLNGGADIQDHVTYNGFPMLVGQIGTATLPAVTAATSSQVAVTFGRTYPSGPAVFVNFSGGSGATSQWSSRALSVSTTGFTAFATGPSSTFGATSVTWLAIHPGV